MKIYTASIPVETLKQRSRDDYYARQKKRLVAIVLLVAIAPLVLIHWQTGWFYQKSWIEKTSAELIGAAHSRKELIDRFLADQEGLMAGLAELYQLDTIGQQENLKHIFNAINKNGVLTDIGVIDSSGRHIAYHGPFAEKLAGKNYANTDWFKKTMQHGRYVSDVFTGYRGVPHTIIAVTSPDKSWLIRATVNSTLFNSLLNKANVGPNGDAFVINMAGELQTPSRLPATDNPLEKVTFFKKIAMDGVGVKQASDMLFSVATVKEGEWLLVLQTDINSSLSEFYRAKNIGMAAIIGAAILIIAAILTLIRALVAKIDKAEQQRIILVGKVREVEKMALIGRLAASVAHEINNPLQIISAQAGWADELLEEGPEKWAENHAEYAKSVRSIREQVKRAGSITRRFLGFARTQDIGVTDTDIHQVLDDTLMLLEKEAQSHSIFIRKNYCNRLAQTRVDASQLQQIFLNILNNAMDAIGKNGTIEINTFHEDGRIRIEFADNGPGIPEHTIDRIFDPFFTTKGKSKGTGLGLAISKNIIERLGGELTASNRTEGGCLFTVSLKVGRQRDGP